jgi:predicted transposase/invertase (TIGR01784 family)
MKNDVFISPLEDFVFKQIFGEQKNIDITRDFLKTLLDIPDDDLGKLTVVNPSLGKILKRGKIGIVDIKLITKSGKIVHIELQVEKRENMKNRITFYSCRQIGDQLNWGDDYDKLKQVISIVICDHVLLDEEDGYRNEYEMRNDKNNSFTKLQKLIILELPKIPETADGTLWPWLRFFTCKSKEEYEMLAKKHPEMEKPIHYAKKMSLYQKWRDYQLYKSLARTDEKMLKLQWKNDGLAEGRAQGLVEGRTEGRVESDKKWQSVVVEKDIEFAEKEAVFQTTIADKEKEITASKAEIARLREQIAKSK